MKKIVLLILIIFISAPLFAETITLVTYYPGPIGAYSQLRLTPIDTNINPVVCSADNEGLVYFDDILNLLMFCGDTGASVGLQTLTTWVQNGNLIFPADASDDIYIGIGDFDPDSLLEVSSSGFALDYFYLSSNDNADGDILSVRSNGNVGIGSNSPSFRLTLDESKGVSADGGILSFGSLDNGADLTYAGEGTRLIWYPKKNAFRAGYVDDDQWDDATIGNDSVAFGLNSSAVSNSTTALSGGIASAIYATAIGNEARAPGPSALAIGLRVTSAKTGATTLGLDSTASDNSSVSMGNTNASLGPYSVTLGFSNVANSDGSVAIGNSCDVTGNNSSAWGESNLIEGAIGAVVMGKDSVANLSANYSTVIGHMNTAIGQYSTVLGNYSTALGDYAFTLSGSGTNAQSYASVAFGRYNVLYDVVAGNVNPTGITLTDPIFVIGNGTDSSNRANAFTIRKNGNVAIGSDDPAGYRLRVYGGDAKIDAAFDWTDTSDARLKKDIVPLSGCLENVSQLESVTYHVLNESEQDKKHLGLIAQDVENYYPEIVSTASNGYKSIGYGRIAPILVEAIKELKAENENLENTLKDLENQIDKKIERLNTK